MTRKTFDEMCDEYNAAEDKPVETVSETTETSDTPADTEQPGEERQTEETPTDDTPAPEPEKKTDEPVSDPVIDEIETANAGIRKRLAKQAQKYEADLAERDEKYSKLEKEFEEFKAKHTPKPETKKREDFETDEEYIHHMNRADVEEILAQKEKERADKEAAKAAEEAKLKAEKEAEEAEIRSLHKRFHNNIEQCFEGEARDQLEKRIKYATSKGFGDLLDANPIAFNYLLSTSKGPLVLAKILSEDTSYFKRVFPPQGIDPLEQYSELKEIEREALAERRGERPDTAAKPKPKVTLGKPGAQGSGGTGGDPMADPKQRRDYVRSLLWGHK